MVVADYPAVHSPGFSNMSDSHHDSNMFRQG